MASKRSDKEFGTLSEIEARLRNHLKSVKPPEELSDELFLKNLMERLDSANEFDTVESPDAVEHTHEGALQSSAPTIRKGTERPLSTDSKISPLKKLDRWLCSLPTSLVGIAASILIIITLYTTLSFTLSGGAKASMDFGTELALLSLNHAGAAQRAAYKATDIGLSIFEFLSR